MSKSLGKMLLESGHFKEKSFSGAMFKIRGSGSECVVSFKCGSGRSDGRGGFSVSVPYSIVEYVLRRYESEDPKSAPFLYQWSVGYVCKSKRPSNEWFSVYKGECEDLYGDAVRGIDGWKLMILDLGLESDEAYWVFSAICYLYKLSLTVLERARRNVWVQLEKRVVRGTRGAYQKASGEDLSASTFDTKLSEETYLYNRKVAIERGRLDWFLDNEKEWKKSLGEKWNISLQQKLLKEWNELRYNNGD